MWTLTVRTSLPEVCRSDDDLTLTTSVYETFDEAKLSFQKTLKKLAFSENAMFDGEGHLTQLEYYIEDRENTEKEYPPETDDPSDWISSKVLYVLRNNLQQLFTGDAAGTLLPDGQYEDGFILIRVNDGCVRINGWDDGPINGISPRISINAFDMSTSKNYHLHIDDMFGGLWGQEASAELYIDLVEASTDNSNN